MMSPVFISFVGAAASEDDSDVEPDGVSLSEESVTAVVDIEDTKNVAEDVRIVAGEIVADDSRIDDDEGNDEI